ncbi:MAG: SDR family NAD(P)-dependent oxidoreductase, partial [Cyanobacteria bacterium P01_D01_bin.116]
NQCCEILETYLDKPLLEILYGDEASENVLAQTAYTQVALFAIEYALYKLWQSWGIKPSVVMGHSVGEYVAATVAGVLSLEEGLKLIAHRGRLMQQLPPGGEMLSVMASEKQINQIITPYSQEVTIAAINGPESVVISGEAEALATVKEILDSLEIKTKQLQVSHGFHSHLMEPMLADFKVIASEITYNQPRIPLISNITGVKADESIATPDYWVNHVRQPVKFAQSMATLHQEGYEVFLEIGPKPILLGMGRQCLPEDVGVWLPSLRPNQDDWQLLLQSLGELYVRGVQVDWVGFDQDYHRSKVTLPTYPFQRQRYWLETSEARNQIATDSDSEHQTTEIFNLLKYGNTQELAKQIEQAGQFSPEQVNFLPEMLEIMVQQHQKQLVSETTKDFFYQVEWKHEVVDTQTLVKIEPGNWLIFADTTGVGEKLAQQLSQRECQCSLVYRSEEYQQLNESTYQLNPAEPQEFEQLLEAIGAQSKLPLRGVIHLWSLDAPKTQDLTITTLEQAQRWGCGAVLEIVKALIKTKNVAKLWLITRGAIAVKSPRESVSVAASPLWGMGRVIALEHPQMWGGMVDLDPQTSETETETLLQLLANHHQPEDHLALRAEQRYIPRLVKQSWQASPVPSFDSNATYLITGGLGALGLHTASWMVSQGAKNLVLISRTQPSEAKLAAISDLQQQGASIVVAQADVCNFEELSRVLEQVDNSQTALKGIVHGAGMGGFQPMQQMELTELEQVMAAKVMGGWNLHQLTLDLELDFFVSFSSIAAVWGGAGQAHYAAANHFLDGLTHYRRGSGLPSLSINWGPWSGGGMAEGIELEQLRRRGIEALSPQQGISALEQLWRSGKPQTTVANVNWSLFKQLYEVGGQKLLCEIEVETLATQELNSKQNQLLKRLESLPSGEQYHVLRTEIQTEVAKVLGLSDDQLPDFEEGFFELGMDSLMAVELRNRITQLLGVKLPSTLSFDFPNIEQLTKYLSSQVLQLSSEDDDQQPEPSIKTMEHEPIAIIGMGCSFPGGASTPEKFWELLHSGTSTHTEIPASRWDINTYYDPDRETAGKMVTRYGNFINGVEQFDPGFFGISPREATAIDPQHRLLLEVSWQALERAGQKVERLASEPVGVFVGLWLLLPLEKSQKILG